MMSNERRRSLTHCFEYLEIRQVHWLRLGKLMPRFTISFDNDDGFEEKEVNKLSEYIYREDHHLQNVIVGLKD
jgi:predicted metal-dependent hydrolase